MRSPRYFHTDLIFVNIDILKLSSFLKFEISMFIHRVFFTKYHIFNLTPRSLAHSYITRFNTDISLSHIRTYLAANFVLHKGVKMYNNLPIELNYINDFQKFKRTVKPYLLIIHWYSGRLRYRILYDIYIYIY